MSEEIRMTDEQRNEERNIKKMLATERSMPKCPFCGGMPRIEVLAYHKKSTGGDDVEAEKARIYCRICGASTKVWERDATDEVIDNDAIGTARAAWGMRARS